MEWITTVLEAARKRNTDGYLVLHNWMCSNYSFKAEYDFDNAWGLCTTQSNMQHLQFQAADPRR